MDRFTGMRLFTRVVESESFSEAARQLGLAPSSVSRRINALEDELGVRLLNRTTRRLSSTEAGLIYYQRAVRILADAEEAKLAVSRLEATPKGRLRISTPISFGRLHIAAALPSFHARYPLVQIDLSASDSIVDLVAEGFDLAVRMGALRDSSLIARKLAPNRRVICGSPTYLERAGVPETPDELVHHNCLTFEYQARGKVWQLKGRDGTKKVPVSGSLHTNNGEILLAAVLGGLGLAMLPTWHAGKEIQRGALQAVLTAYEVGPTSNIYAVYPHNRHLAPKVRAFVDFLVQRFASEPYWEVPVGADRGRHRTSRSSAGASIE